MGDLEEGYPVDINALHDDDVGPPKNGLKCDKKVPKF